MSGSPQTRPSLLLRMRNGKDSQAWSQFMEIYAPLVYRYAKRRGLQDADAADVVQEVLQAVSASMPRFDYDRSRGSFRGWLFTVTRSKLNNHLEKRRRHVRGSGDTQIKQLIESQPDQDDEEKTWDLDYRRRLFDWVVPQVKPGFKSKTWDAFWQTAVEQKPVQGVAQSLEMSVGAIYIAKSRVLTRIREQIQQITGDESTRDDTALVEG